MLKVRTRAETTTKRWPSARKKCGETSKTNDKKRIRKNNISRQFDSNIRQKKVFTLHDSAHKTNSLLLLRSKMVVRAVSELLIYSHFVSVWFGVFKTCPDIPKSLLWSLGFSRAHARNRTSSLAFIEYSFKNPMGHMRFENILKTTNI